MAQPAPPSMTCPSSLCYFVLLFRAVDLQPPLLARPDSVLLSTASHVPWPRSELALISTFVCAGAGELPRELWLLEADQDAPCRVPSNAPVSGLTESRGALLVLAEGAAPVLL